VAPLTLVQATQEILKRPKGIMELYVSKWMNEWILTACVGCQKEEIWKYVVLKGEKD
jgi:hypothetical protein